MRLKPNFRTQNSMELQLKIPIFKDLTFRTLFELLNFYQEGFDRNDSGLAII